MKYKNTINSWIIGIAAGLIVIGLLIWGNYSYARQNPGGNDFLVHWVGTRALFTDGLSPYSDEVALQIQTMVYGREALPGEHELRVAYPLYSVVLFVPFAMIGDFTMARAVWMTFLELCLAGMALLGLKLVNSKPKPIYLGVTLIFTFFWYYSLRALINGNAIIVITLLLICVFLAMKNKADELAGVLLAFATIKPQVVFLIVLFILYYAWMRGRRKLILWFFITLILSSVTAMLLVPDWIVQNLREIVRFSSYNPPGTPTAIMETWWGAIGRRLGTVISMGVFVMLGLEWWIARKADFRHFLWVACLTLAAGQWIGIYADPGNFLVIYPALLFVFAVWEKRSPKTGPLVSMAFMGVIMVLIWVLFLVTLEHSYQPVQSPIMLFPLPAIGIILLYWIRWWTLRPNLWADKILDIE